jgi:quinone-modifying oxidoreductase subunit QmoB
MNNVGVFVCTGCEIGTAVPLEDFEEVATDAGASSYHTHEFLCSPEGVATIQGAIDEGVDGVVIAACSHRAKIDEFKFDPTKVHVERVCLREQVAWCQPPGEEDTQMLAEDLLRMGLAKATTVKTPVPLSEEVERTVLIVGGGLAGLEAAQAAAGMGNPVVLVEAEDKLGGYVATMKDVVPEIPPYDTIHANPIGNLIEAVETNPQIKVFKSTMTKKIDVQPGQFEI